MTGKLEEAVERIKDALGFEYFKLPPSDRNELLKEIQQWCETNVDKMKIPRGRRYDTIEDLHADDMLTSGKPWTKSRQPKTPYTEEEKWFAQTYGLPLRTVRRKLKKDGYICP